MKPFRIFICILLFFSPLLRRGAGGEAFAQRSKHGTPAPIAGTVTVNEYTALTLDAAANATIITVAASSLNATPRFPANLGPGDLIMIIQMQGATILGAPFAGNPPSTPIDSTWGAITTYNNCGNWEFAEVKSVPNATSIALDCPLTYSYTATGKTQVVRVPRYSSLTVNAGGVITCDTWNGTIGGVCAIEVEFNTTINGSINATGKGFRGGQIHNIGIAPMNLFFSASSINDDGAEKGEGIAGYKTDYTQYGGMYMRGAPANGGGGANIHNGGGGGGANGGNPASWNGHGMPDPNAAYVNAWNKQYANFATQTSSGGGQGGYAWSASAADPTSNPICNNGIWGGQSRCAIGGYGGRPLNYSTGRLFLGGGGGAGDQNDNSGGSGSIGGGLIYLMDYGLVSGTGQFISNGNAGGNTFNQYKDGAGGGGAGGTIIVNAVGAITGVSLTANGGKGGDQTFVIPTQQAEGPGGGGGGGYIAISNGAPTITTNGGNNGITNSTGLGTPSKFPPNGATAGGAGTNAAVVTNFVINAANTTICTGQAATLTATLIPAQSGTVTIIWYDALVGGNVLPSTGGTLTTSLIVTAGTYTYYVGTCPGTYHQPVLLTVTNAPTISVCPNSTICTAGNTTLSASGATSYTWAPTTGLSNPNISNPVANPASTTTYVVTATTPCGTATGSVVVTVQSSLPPTIAGNTSICIGGNTTLTASGGGTYSWSNGLSSTAITVFPTTTTTYTLNAINGTCTGTTSITVNVTSGITATIFPGNSTLCPGSPTTLTASGGNNYSWSTTETTATINVTPSATTTYTVNVTSGSCSSTASVTLTITNSLAATINGPTNICTGGNAILTATGGGTYAWSTTETTAAITVTPTGTTTYSVLVSAGACTATASITVNVGANITAAITGPVTICGGSSATLTASGGSNYSWNTGASSAAVTVTPAASTTTNYSVIVSSGSCADTATFTVNSLPPLFTYVAGSTVICQGDVSTLTASVNNPVNNTYLWSTGATATTVLVSPSVTTTYSVSGYSGNCSNTVPYTITVIPQASATVSPSATICAGQSTTLSVTGGSVYSWSTGAATSAITVSPLLSSTYTVIAGIGACSSIDSISVTVQPSLTVTITSSATTICGGDVVTLNASGGTGYAWSNTATSSTTTVNPAITTTYTVISTSGFCNDTETVTITVSPPPAAGITGNNNICQGLSATLTTAPSGATYAWSSGETTQTIHPAISGSYSVVVSVGSCKDTAYITTAVVPNPVASVFSDITIIQGQNANLSATGGTNYVWDNSMSGANITVSPNVTTVYCVTVYDANGCYDSACVIVTVELCSNAGTLYLPNAFSPNGDGENDELQIYYGLPACIEKFRLTLYNRWGEKIYQTTDAAFKWDGSYKGWIFGKEAGGTEIYSYYMEAEIVDGTNFSGKGNISLLR
ncbi:MAG: hypothetical protein EPN85_12900 [Bacteroidetes bacterium]|nr:MAG: hypothetical protein EPN85_12900 [Bacteroidota bacterium]